MQFPHSLIEYLSQAKEEITQGCLKELDFTGNAYQILIHDRKEKKPYWVFIQLDRSDNLTEAICECTEEESELSGCWHKAAAFLYCFGHESKSMGVRFQESLWYLQLQHLHLQLGNQSCCLHQLASYGWESISSGGKRIFLLETSNKKIFAELQKLLYERAKATEENSFVLSQFSYDEILKWREGKPSPELKYRLSFWYDLAKYFFIKQERSEFQQISFRYNQHDIPNWIQAEFQNLSLGFYISQANLPNIIPSLTRMNSPLKVVQNQIMDLIGLEYDKATGQMHVKPKKGKKVATAKQGISLNGWRYIPQQGFYSDIPKEVLESPILEGKPLVDALDNYLSIFSALLPEMTFKMTPTPLSFELFFDKNWDLHIIAYLFEQRDLLKGYSRLIHHWAYLDGEGFFRLQDVLFDTVETIISKERLSEFITLHRTWLSSQKGFKVHIRSIEYKMGYYVEADRLHFFRKSISEFNEDSFQDFSAWIYIRNQGFFSKSSSGSGFLLKPGLEVSSDQLPLFIKLNSEELSHIPGFFLPFSPIKEAGLAISLDKNRDLKITPTYQCTPEYKDVKLHFFEDVVYAEQKGFFQLSPQLHLPDEYLEETIIKGEALEEFLLHQWEKVAPFIQQLDKELIKPKYLQLQVNSIEAYPEKGRGWYLFSFSYHSDLGHFSFHELQKAIKKKQRFAFTKAGLIDLHEKRFEWLLRLKKERLETKKSTVVLSLLELMRLNAYDPIKWSEKGAKGEKETFEKLMSFKQNQVPDFNGLKCALRPYQDLGVRWLWFLYQEQLSGLLCDEMGLGKTHQAMALIRSILNIYSEFAEGLCGKFLIVCPTSVIHHWEDKIRQFLPGVTLFTFYGSQRKMEDTAHFDILLTSYGILRNEKKKISALPFELAIFDEIQLAKNSSSQIYSSLLMVQANMKLGLTGTPIENRLRELKSLFDIILPSYMPGETEYRNYFIRPIEKENLNGRKEELKRLVNPFILRRKKSEVLTELPEKIEEIAYCDLSPYQQQLYDEVLSGQRTKLIQELENEEQPIPYLHIFTLLSSLKQICDHPAVYLKRPQDYKLYTSGKWDLFLELLSEARESNQKVVVFSQYLHMLDIIIQELTEQNIGFATIRGSTRDRKKQIDKFNQDPNCEVFVGSLHAAGLGVDLTAASNVFHIDRWWNKAREDQATDRVHRMGQTRGVQVFKFVTQATFEERINEMIEAKGVLLEEIVQADDHGVLKSFTREELFDLLSFRKKS